MEKKDFHDPVGRVWKVEGDSEVIRTFEDLDLVEACNNVFGDGDQDELESYISDLRDKMESHDEERMSIMEALEDLNSDSGEITRYLTAGLLKRAASSDDSKESDVEEEPSKEDLEDIESDEEDTESWISAPASIEYLLESFDVENPPIFDDIAEALGASPESETDPAAIEKLLGSYLDVYPLKSIDDLATAVQNGDPALVKVEKDDEECFVVLEDFDSKSEEFKGYCPLSGAYIISAQDVESENFWALGISDSKDEEAKPSMFMDTTTVSSEEGEELAKVSNLRTAMQIADTDSTFKPGKRYIISQSRVRVRDGRFKGASIMKEFSYDPNSHEIVLLATNKNRVKITSKPKVVAKPTLPNSIPFHKIGSVPFGRFDEISPGKFTLRVKKGCGFDDADGSEWQLMNEPGGLSVQFATFDQLSPFGDLKERAKQWKEKKFGVEDSISSLKQDVDSLVQDAISKGYKIESEEEKALTDLRDMGVSVNETIAPASTEPVNYTQGPIKAEFGD